MKYALWAILALLLLGGFSAMSSYNGLRLPSKKDRRLAEWANVETQYQRRFDLIPNLVATVTRRWPTSRREHPDRRDRGPRLRLQRHAGSG